jgi:hypothetical protein
MTIRSANVRYSAFSELENDHDVWAGLRCSVHGGGAVEGGHSESDRGGGAGAPVDLGELVLGAGEADRESFGFAEPAFAVGFGDTGDQVVADLGDAVLLGGVGPVQGASQAAVLVDAGGGEGAAAGAGGRRQYAPRASTSPELQKLPPLFS